MAEIHVLPRGTHRLRPIAATVVPHLWGQVEPLLAPAIRDPLYTPIDLYLDLAGGRATLWLIERGQEIRAALVTRMTEFSGGRSMRIQLCGGEGMEDWLPLLSSLEDHAREYSCARVEIEGRKGWLRVLPGYRERAILMGKEL